MTAPPPADSWPDVTPPASGPARPPWLTSTASCKWCDAPVVWAKAGDDRICFDADPVDPNRGAGTHLLSDRGPGLAPLAELVTNKTHVFGRKALWRRHLDTCRRADFYRHLKRKRGICDDVEYQIVRRRGAGATVSMIRIACETTADHVMSVLTDTGCWDRERARDMARAWKEAHRDDG